MSAAKKLERMPEEVFIEDALKSGRAAIQKKFSMKALGKPDVSLQARVHRGVVGPKEHLDMGHVARLGHILETIGPLHPAIIFTDGKKYWLADGFHRHEAYRIAKCEFIAAIVVQGDYQAALEYATMCNRLSMLGRSKEDETKSVEMLLRNELWWARTDSAIADHIGTGRDKVRRVRAQLAITLGRPVPETLVTADGRCVPSTRPARKSDVFHRRVVPRQDGRVAICYKGSMITAANRGALQQRLFEQNAADSLKQLSVAYSAIKGRLNSMGFSSVFEKGLYPGLSAFVRPGIVVARCDFTTKESLPSAVGSLVAARGLHGQGARAIILCYQETMYERHIELYRKAGIEFMTPEELIESLKARAE